ncbi:hypothetical protein BDF22DRAFT_681794 [Syncephalis plumigaleata]|nr:hypothetical protein BDF22DRAFT_681794 [Syncephalis plumigaleata]
MSQPTSADLAAHLELVEQNITLTLQQIDHNFAAAITRKFGDISIKIWEGSQSKASIPLPPSPTETTNSPDRSERAELSTRLEYSRALSHMKTSRTRHQLHYTPVRPNLSRAIAEEPVGTSVASASVLSSIREQPGIAFEPWFREYIHGSTIATLSLLHAGNSMLRATPLKARPPKMASTPRLLQQVLTANTKANINNNQLKRQTMTPRRDHHTLFDVATPCSDATTSEDEDDVDAVTTGNYINKKFKANESDEVGDSTDRYLEMNSPPVTLQFTLPIAKTPGRTAVDAIIDEISPGSNSPSNTEFLTRMQETTMANQGNRGASAASNAHDNPFESSMAGGGVLFGKNNANSNQQSRPYDSVNGVPSFEGSTLGGQPSNTGGSIMPDRPANPLFQEEHMSDEDISMEEQSHAMTSNQAVQQPNRKSVFTQGNDSTATATSEASTTFDLSLFPSAFQGFQDNANQLLDMAALEQLLPDFGTDRITLLVDLLVRRRFVDRHQDPQQAWNIQWSLHSSD